jgi:hypothetical protein
LFAIVARLLVGPTIRLMFTSAGIHPIANDRSSRDALEIAAFGETHEPV